MEQTPTSFLIENFEDDKRCIFAYLRICHLNYDIIRNLQSYYRLLPAKEKGYLWNEFYDLLRNFQEKHFAKEIFDFLDKNGFSYQTRLSMQLSEIEQHIYEDILSTATYDEVSFLLWALHYPLHLNTLLSWQLNKNLLDKNPSSNTKELISDFEILSPDLQRRVISYTKKLIKLQG